MDPMLEAYYAQRREGHCPDTAWILARRATASSNEAEPKCMHFEPVRQCLVCKPFQTEAGRDD